MAILTVDSLTGCSSIPSFMGGSADTPSNPTISTFWQTSAPTSWTKVTTWDNRGLRVIGASNGTPITTGGTLPFTQTFTSRSVGPGNSGSQNLVGTQITQATISAPAATGDMQQFTTTTANTTINGTQTAAHAGHTFPVAQVLQSNTVTSPAPVISCANAPTPSTTGNPTVGAAAHNHPISAPHTHPVTIVQHSHNSSPTAQGSHLHAYSGSYDFSVLYVDVILATKN